ncbi:hypothetical protein F5Y05DRAFT_420063 [Hypoxylon sp. FL0543]|nr:hypothetical protein F5Y05DRAFT_420063 [Hypoxylon sp. FL0543]
MPGFTDLPPELRVVIWELCLPGPRNVTVLERHTPAPVVLHVCRESRDLAQQSYELAFSVVSKLSWGAYGPIIDFERRPVVWFNFKEDRLCLDSTNIKYGPYLKSFKRLRSLGLRCWPGGSPWNLLLTVCDKLGRWENVLEGLTEIVFFGPLVTSVSVLKWYRSENAAGDPDNQRDACERLRKRLTRRLSVLNDCMVPMRWVPANSAHDYDFNDPTDALAAECARYYVFLCATTGQLEVQRLTKDQLGWKKRSGCRKRGFGGCLEHPWDLSTSEDELCRNKKRMRSKKTKAQLYDVHVAKRLMKNVNR